MSSGQRATPPAVNAWNAEYLEAEYERFRRDPGSVPEDLRAFFRGFDLGLSREAAPRAEAPAPGGVSPFQSAADDLIASYRSLGHLSARLDPFGRESQRPEELTLAAHGLDESDLDRLVDLRTLNLHVMSLREAVSRLESTYCGSIGAEIAHVQDGRERQWLFERFERDQGRVALSTGQRAHILRQLLEAESFELFLHSRYPSEKRFSLEGAESLIPLLDRFAEGASDLGVDEIVLGMSHRGRLNVLANILRKTHEQIFTEFEDNWDEDFADGGGDVKYHRGYSGKRQFPGGRTLRIAMASNPSHLESVDAVVEGRCRAKQRLRGDGERVRVIPVLVHGDAAIAGQGMVAEVLNLSRLEGYTTGGTVHVVVNNLVGFTTSPEHARSTRYCTDVAKMIEAPIFHVNGEDPEAVVAAAQFAIEYRQKFRKDVVIDLYCYRRYGHNEQDEASFTQPVLYALIRGKQSVLRVYAERLLAEGVISEADMATIRGTLEDALAKAQESARRSPYDPTIDPGSERWAGIVGEYSHGPVETGVSEAMLREVCAGLGRVPETFHLHRKLGRLLEQRRSIVETGEVCHADAELLAFGSLLLEGVAVRLTGQDTRRGTFSQRHGALFDQETGQAYIPLNSMREVGVPGTDSPPGSVGPDGRARQARLCIHDSPLSEQSIVAFEYGYSLADPNMLVLWEAQFGDFANGAQVIIDQYLASAEIKWERWSGLVLLLPHGYEGAGPEHSSARIERFLDLCAGGNMQVVHPSTAAQFFHLLRRQVKRPFRKPLVVTTPKSLLRVNTSRVQELVSGRFHEILDDPAFDGAAEAQRRQVSRIVLCSGKVCHELAARREEAGRRDVAIIRVEQLHPFHADLAREVLSRYPAAVERIWAQEEPRNMGAYLHIADVCRTELGFDPVYIGREASATTAVGSKSRHKVEQESILSRAVAPRPRAAAAAPPAGDPPPRGRSLSTRN